MKDRRNDYEDELLDRLREAVEEHVRVVIIANRGFADVALYQHIVGLDFHYVIRLKRNINVYLDPYTIVSPVELISPHGVPIRYESLALTDEQVEVPGVVTVHAPGMKEPWFLATSLPDPAPIIVQIYGYRFTIEETFRDKKDPRFGMGDAIGTYRETRTQRSFVAHCKYRPCTTYIA